MGIGDCKRAFVYEDEHTAAISFPLGGIGTGSIGLSGGGRLVDWEILNRPAKGKTNGLSHFAVRAERAGEVLDARILNGPYRGSAMGELNGEPYRSFGFGATRNSLVGLPHFRTATFDGRFPVAQLAFADPAFPGEVRLAAFNPFIPTAERDSSRPVALFEVSFHNTTAQTLDYTLSAVLGHAMAGSSTAVPLEHATWRGIGIRNDRAADDPDFAELVIATDASETSRQTYLFRGLWYDALEVYWRDLCTPGRFCDRRYDQHTAASGMIRDPDCSLQAVHLKIEPGATRTVRILIAWYCPIFRKYWVSPVWHFKEPSLARGEWPNWYATEWASAEAIAHETFDEWERLRHETFSFRDALYRTTLPSPMVEAAGANLSILKSPTVLRLPDGTLYGWEGCHSHSGSCEGSCTHVWNYQQALAFLFPRLSRGMRVADYRYNLEDTGRMSFRLGLPPGTRLSTEHACVDGQFGSVMLVYREWLLSGDDAWLAALFPAVRQSIEYAWHPENPDLWDPGRSGILTGRQHHTLDMELFGANAWLNGYYVGALAAAAEMADALGEHALAADYRALAATGRQQIDTLLFNGAYFIQDIDLTDRSVLAPYGHHERSRRLMGASVDELYWDEEHGEIRYQFAGGCFVDQLASQCHASLYGLPPIFAEAKAKAALTAVFRHNHARSLGDVVNPGRVFGFGDEAGTVVLTWPDPKQRPAVGAPYAQETLHGMEYAFATTLLQYGMTEEAAEVVSAVRRRYDGRIRNPWSEMECGSNYARSLASWGLVIAGSGYQFDARQQQLGFVPRFHRRSRFRTVWSAAEAWGIVVLSPSRLVLRVEHGRLPLCGIALPDGATGLKAIRRNGHPFEATLMDGIVNFAQTTLERNDVLALSAERILSPAHLQALGDCR